MKTILISSLAFLTVLFSGCGGGGVKMISDADVVERIERELIKMFVLGEVPIDMSGNPSLLQASRDALAEAYAEMLAEDFFGNIERSLSIVVDGELTSPTYEPVAASEAIKDYSAFLRAQAVANQLRLRTLTVPRAPGFAKEASPAGTSLKVKFTARVAFAVDRESNTVVIVEARPEDLDLEGVAGDDFVVGHNTVLVGSPEAAAVEAQFVAFVDAVGNAVAAAEQEKEAQKQRDAAVEKATAEAMSAFGGRYEVDLTSARDSSTDRFSFYFTHDQDGNTVIVFEPVNDTRGISRNFRFRIPANGVTNNFSEDGTVVVSVAGTARPTTHNTRIPQLPSLFRAGGASLTMTAISSSPGEIIISGRYFTGVARKVN